MEHPFICSRATSLLFVLVMKLKAQMLSHPQGAPEHPGNSWKRTSTFFVTFNKRTGEIRGKMTEK